MEQVSMRFLALILILAFPLSPQSRDEAPWSVKPAKIVAIAFDALEKKYPDVQLESLRLSNDIYVYCESTRLREHVPVLEEEFQRCWGSVHIDLRGTSLESFHLDRDGTCAIASPPSAAFISVYADGSSEVKPLRGKNTPEQTMDCTKEVVTELASAAEPIPGDDDAFFVDAKRVLELAFVVAIEEYPEVRPEDWDFEFYLTLFCDVYPHPAKRSPLDLKIKPCVAEVTFLDRSVVVEERRIDSEGRCWLSEAAEGIRVYVYEDETTRTKGSKSVGDFMPREVECTKDFEKSVGESFNKSLNTDAPRRAG